MTLRRQTTHTDRVSTLIKAVAIACLLAQHAWARQWYLPPDGVDIFGQEQVIAAKAEDTLLDIARRYSIGQDEIIQANPDVDRWLPGAGTKVIIPSRYILPTGQRTGLLINLPEMRLYYFPQELPDQLLTYPVSVGRMDWNTPLGLTQVVSKIKNPTWTPPQSIREEHAAKGDILPKVVPAGPDNPLGHRALRLGIPAYLIHGTNNPWGVGMRVTHGCVRMYPEDIEALFEQIAVNTAVQFVDEPVKVALNGSMLFVEVHPPLEEQQMDNETLIMHAQETILSKTGRSPESYDQQALWEAIVLKTGVPSFIPEPQSQPSQDLF